MGNPYSGLSSAAIAAKRERRDLEVRNAQTIDFNRTGRRRSLEDIFDIPVKTAAQMLAECRCHTCVATATRREIPSMESLKNKLWGQGQVIFGEQRRAREKAEQERRNREAHRELFPMEFND